VTLSAFIASYGVVAVFLGCAVEGETSAFVGGVMAHRGLLGWGEMALAAGLGSLLSDQVMFWSGRRMRDRQWVRRLLDRPAAGRVHGILHDHPKLFVVGFRFIPGMRMIGPLTMGASGIAPALFVPINLITALFWGAAITTVGYHFGRAVEALFGRLHLLPLTALAVAGGLSLLVLLRLLRRAKR